MGAAASIDSFVRDYNEQEFKEIVEKAYGKAAVNKFYKRYKNAAGIVPADKVKKIVSSMTDVFLSHNWGTDGNGRDNHARVLALAEVLKARGLKCWLDEEEMTGDINKAMCDGINFTRVFVACITEEYVKKVDGQGANGEMDNCLKEFKYARDSKAASRMLAVVMEPHCCKTSDWFGPVEESLGSSLYCSYTNDDDIESTADAIMTEIAKKVGMPTGTVGEEPEEPLENNEEPQYPPEGYAGATCPEGHILTAVTDEDVEIWKGWPCQKCMENKPPTSVCRVCEYMTCLSCNDGVALALNNEKVS